MWFKIPKLRYKTDSPLINLEEEFPVTGFLIQTPDINNICQGYNGNCTFIAVIITMLLTGDIHRIINAEENSKKGRKKYVFYIFGQRIAVDPVVQMKWIWEGNHFSPKHIHCHNKNYPGELCFPLLEKAYIKYLKEHAGSGLITEDYRYTHAVFTLNHLNPLLGHVKHNYIPISEISEKLKAGYPIICSSQYSYYKETIVEVCKYIQLDRFVCPLGDILRNRIVSQHAYVIMDCIVIEGKEYFKMINPHGTNYYKDHLIPKELETPNDSGIFYISRESFEYWFKPYVIAFIKVDT